MAAPRVPTADGNIEGITISGSVTTDPDPIPTMEFGAATHSRDPCDKHTEGACTGDTNCKWKAGETTPEGDVLPASCISDGSEMGEGPATAGGSMIKVMLNGIAADADGEANLFISGFGQATLRSDSHSTILLPAGTDSANLEVAHESFPQGQATLTVCINKTACPDWSAECAACKHKQVTIGTTTYDDTGNVVDIDSQPPMISFDAGQFNADPDWNMNLLEDVTANIVVIELDSPWQMNCRFVGVDANNAQNDSMCAPGVFEPNVCEGRQAATPPEGAKVKITIGKAMALNGWKEGRYEIHCHAWDFAGGGDSQGNTGTEWVQGFQVGTTTLVTPPPPPETPPDVPPEGTVPPEGSGTAEPPAPTDAGGLPIPTGTPGPGEPEPTATDKPIQPAPATCGDNVCQQDESQENCCNDCGCPVGWSCSGGVCAESSPPTPKPPAPNTAVVAVIAILVVVGGFYALGLKK